MDSFFGRHKNVTVFAVVLFVQFVGLAVQVRRKGDPGDQPLMRRAVVTSASPVEKLLTHSTGFFQRLWADYFYLRNVNEENRHLREQLEQERLRQIRLEQDAMQARRIQALLGFKEQFISKTVAAQVIGTGGSEHSRVLYLDRGAGDGIKPDQAVITPEGIVGKVLSVYGSTCEVLVMTDPTSGVGAILAQSRLQGIVKGSPGGTEARLLNVMADEKVNIGDEVITSGGDGIFPKGMHIGWVTSVAPGHDVFLDIHLKPAAPLNRLEEVLVITEMAVREPDTQNLGPIRAIDILAERLPSASAPKPAPGGSTATPTTANRGFPTATGAATGTPLPAGGSTNNLTNGVPRPRPAAPEAQPKPQNPKPETPSATPAPPGQGH